jgi:glycosyltransferase involved in cell wall biosynthesis
MVSGQNLAMPAQFKPEKSSRRLQPAPAQAGSLGHQNTAMRILVACPAFPPAYSYGGTPMTAFGLAKGLQDLGQEVLVLTTDANGREDLPETPGRLTTFSGVPVIYHHRWGKNPYFWAPGLAGNLKRLASCFDLALVRGNWSYINLAASRTLSGAVPVFLYPEGTFDPWAFRHHRAKKVLYWHLVENRNYRQAATIIALTGSEAQQVKRMGIPGPVEVIPNGVFLSDFAETAFPRTSTDIYQGKRRGDRRVVLYLGRIHLKKGIDTLVAALKIIPREERPLLVIAGHGDRWYENKIKNQVLDLQLTEDVLFTGMVTGAEKFRLLKSSDLLILASRSEGLPHAVLEGMAARKPVIITPACNLPEVEERQAGFVIPEDAAMLAGVIRRLAADPRLREKMGENGYNLVQDRFTWEAVAVKTLELAHRLRRN